MRINQANLIKSIFGTLMLALCWLTWKGLTNTLLQPWPDEAKTMMLLIGGFVYVVIIGLLPQAVANKFTAHRSR